MTATDRVPSTHPRRHRRPGRLLMRVATFVFDEPALTRIIEPAIADFQREVGQAGAIARVRGYIAVAKVFALALLVPAAGAGAPLTYMLLGLGGGSSLALLAPLLFAAVWPIFGVFVVAAIAAGLMLAVGLRVWNSQHPTAVARTRQIYGKDPEINLSAIPVGGNIGGFFFVLASSLTVLLGLPELRWFVLGAVAGGVALAWGLFAWHRAHMASPVRRMVVH
jgi:hypothetical protein